MSVCRLPGQSSESHIALPSPEGYAEYTTKTILCQVDVLWWGVVFAKVGDLEVVFCNVPKVVEKRSKKKPKVIQCSRNGGVWNITRTLQRVCKLLICMLLL